MPLGKIGSFCLMIFSTKSELNWASAMDLMKPSFDIWIKERFRFIRGVKPWIIGIKIFVIISIIPLAFLTRSRAVEAVPKLYRDELACSHEQDSSE
jgi:hypothetical protein